MRAAALLDYKTEPVITELPVPNPGPGQVLIRVAGAGLCHSDLHLASGDIPILPAFPWVLGHEVSGYVEAVGSGVAQVEHGEPVAVFGGWGCGFCTTCLAGEEQLCATTSWVGIGAPGGFAEYLLVPHARHLVPLGDLDPVLAAPLTDAALTPYRAIRKALPRLVPDSSAVVIGAGGLGQCAVQLLNALTPARVLVLDTSVAKRARAVDLGAEAALDPTDCDSADDIQAWSGCAAVLDFVGSDESLAQAARLVGRSGIVVVVGLAGGSLSYRFLAMPTEATVTSSYWGSRNELAEVVALARQGRLTTRVHERDLAAVGSAFEELRRGDVDGRIVLVP